ncbi:MAG TPA: LysM peptidoglycan-binding domain-containing protein [Dehalococcoidia bacterium]|nr:LysM peptidoglycan-binding domain-containing protein [Dehalococcoidia bacterium]
MTQDSKLSRRRVLASALALGLGGVVLKNGNRVAAAADGPHHLVWVWQFSSDASPEKIGLRLREHGLGILLKTHDGIEWMADYDKNPFAVSGPAQVKTLVEYYEAAGIPFHAWTVLHGVDPVREARMAAEVLAVGARSIWLDVEPHAGFWRGTTQDAVTFARELRRLQPNGKVVLSIDPRPWMLTGFPLREFAAISDAIAPQQYWRTFDTPANHRRFQESGYPVPAGGVTPEFLLAVSKVALAPLGKPLLQVGQGATPDKVEFKRFIDGTYGDGGDMVSVWRYGVTSEDVFQLLRAIPPRRPPPPAAAATRPVGPGGVYVVRSGDTLSGIAAAHGVPMGDLASLNGLSDPYILSVGQELKIPGDAAAVAAPSSAPAATQSTSGGRRTYVVQSGDTLGAIAARHGTTAEAIASANGLPDVNAIAAGQELNIPG